MYFAKNIQFTRLIKVKGQLKEFNFRNPNGNQKSIFTVDVIDHRSDRIIFHMQIKDITWEIISTELPAWVKEKEQDLHELITEELKVIALSRQ